MSADELAETARTTARELATLDRHAHEASKRRMRAEALAAIRSSIELDDADFDALGVPRG